MKALSSTHRLLAGVVMAVVGTGLLLHWSLSSSWANGETLLGFTAFFAGSMLALCANHELSGDRS